MPTSSDAALLSTPDLQGKKKKKDKSLKDLRTEAAKKALNPKPQGRTLNNG